MTELEKRVAEFENKHVKICTDDACKMLHKSLMKRKCDTCKSPVVQYRVLQAQKSLLQALIPMNWLVMLVR